MNIKQLKEQIKNLPDEMLVVIDGYEGGLKAVEKTYVIDIYDSKNTSELYGEYTSEEEKFFFFGPLGDNLTPISKAFYLTRAIL